jgi:hypothetical protein
MSNISDILQDSLILVGAYAQGQTPNTDDMNLAFRVINRKIDSLSAEKLSMLGLAYHQFGLFGYASYTFGPGMQWSPGARPIKIKSASTLSVLNTEHPARICTADQWAAIDDKSRSGVYAEAIFYDNGFPTGNIWLTPRPSQGTMVLWTYEAIPQLPGQTGTVNLAPGYEEVIVNIAAVELCIAFQRPVTQELMASAVQAKDAIVQLNAEISDAPAPSPAGPNPASQPALRAT